MQLQKARVRGVRGILQNIFLNPSLDLSKYKREVNDFWSVTGTLMLTYSWTYWKIDYIIK